MERKEELHRMKRDELNLIAENLGIENPSALPNKGVVIDEILKVEPKAEKTIDNPKAEPEVESEEPIEAKKVVWDGRFSTRTKRNR